MISPFLGIGGLERMILMLGRALKRSARAWPTVLAYDQTFSSQAESLASHFQADNIAVEVFKKPRRFSLMVVRRITKNVKRNNINILHSHHLGGLIYAFLANWASGNRLKLIHTQHSFIHLAQKQRYTFYEKIFTRFVDRLTVVSEATRQTYVELGCPRERIELVPNGVEFLEGPLRDRAEKLVIRKTLLGSLDPAVTEVLKRHEDDFWIMYLARLHPDKGQPGALQVWRELAPEVRQRSALLFVGPEALPDEAQKLREQFAGLPDTERLHITGQTFDPLAWLQAGDIYLSSSASEGMPLSALEAAGSGLPSVLSQIPGHIFLEPCAALYPLEDPKIGAQMIGATIARLEENSSRYYQELWQNSRWIATEHSPANMAERYAEIYRAVLS